MTNSCTGNQGVIPTTLFRFAHFLRTPATSLTSPKRTRRLLWLLLSCQLGLWIMASTAYGQINLIPNPSSSDNGVSNSTILYNNKICFIYYGSGNAAKAQLAQYDGTSITRIPNPTNDGEIYGFLTVYNNKLCFSYRSGSGKNQVAYYDGTSITLIDNPDANDAGFSGYPIVYNDNLYFQYSDPGGQIRLAQFNGTSVTLINNPDGSSQFDIGYYGYPIVYNNNLYFQYTQTVYEGGDPTYIFRLAQFNGTSMTFIDNADGTVQNDNNSFSFPIVYNNNLYFPYQNSSGNFQLAQYNGTNMSLIANPAGDGKGVNNNASIVFNNKLYFRYKNSSNNFQLAQYDGTSITLTPNTNAADAGFLGNSLVYNNKLYFMYGNENYHYFLAQYDGTNLSLTNNLNDSDAGFTGAPIVYNSNLYFQYSNSNGNYQVAQYDGTNLSLINNLNDSDAGYNGYPIVYKNKLYFQYGHGLYPDTKGSLAFLSTNSAPELAVSASTSPICAGSTATLSVTATGSSAPFSYTWVAPPGITLSATSTSAVSASVSTNLSGVQTLTLTVANADNLVSTTTVSLTVNALSTSVKANPPATLAVLGPGNCPVNVQATITGNGVVFTGPGGYVFSNVYRRSGTYTANASGIKQPGSFTITATTTNACGERITDVITFEITGTGCN